MSGWSRSLILLVLFWTAGLAAAPPAAAQRVHQVAPGQTLSSLARRYKVAVWDLALENEMRPGGTLRAGQQLTIPPRGVTYVRPGQTLSQIAKEHGCSIEVLQRLNGLHRTTALRAGARLNLPGSDALVPVDPNRDWGAPAQPGFVTLEGRAGRAEVEIVDAEGRLRLKGLRALTELMRGDAIGDTRSAHPRLALLLARISDRFGGRVIRVVSGLREARGFTRDTSRHTQGRAADIQVVGVPARAVFEYCRSLAQTGCGLYPRSVFVHVDVREHAAQWVDWSDQGQRPRYGTLQRPYRRGESKRRDRPRLTRAVTRPEELPLTLDVVNRYNAIVRSVDERLAGDAAPGPDELDELQVEGGEEQAVPAVEASPEADRTLHSG